MRICFMALYLFVVSNMLLPISSLSAYEVSVVQVCSNTPYLKTTLSNGQELEMSPKVRSELHQGDSLEIVAERPFPFSEGNSIFAVIHNEKNKLFFAFGKSQNVDWGGVSPYATEIIKTKFAPLWGYSGNYYFFLTLADGSEICLGYFKYVNLTSALFEREKQGIQKWEEELRANMALGEVVVAEEMSWAYTTRLRVPSTGYVFKGRLLKGNSSFHDFLPSSLSWEIAEPLYKYFIPEMFDVNRIPDDVVDWLNP